MTAPERIYFRRAPWKLGQVMKPETCCQCGCDIAVKQQAYKPLVEHRSENPDLNVRKKMRLCVACGLKEAT